MPASDRPLAERHGEAGVPHSTVLDASANTAANNRDRLRHQFAADLVGSARDQEWGRGVAGCIQGLHGFGIQGGADGGV
jgi:hypothetical protein